MDQLLFQTELVPKFLAIKKKFMIKTQKIFKNQMVKKKIYKKISKQNKIRYEIKNTNKENAFLY